jgi:hypothetical protein
MTYAVQNICAQEELISGFWMCSEQVLYGQSEERLRRNSPGHAGAPCLGSHETATQDRWLSHAPLSRLLGSAAHDRALKHHGRRNRSPGCKHRLLPARSRTSGLMPGAPQPESSLSHETDGGGAQLHGSDVVGKEQQSG